MAQQDKPRQPLPGYKFPPTCKTFGRGTRRFQASWFGQEDWKLLNFHASWHLDASWACFPRIWACLLCVQRVMRKWYGLSSMNTNFLKPMRSNHECCDREYSLIRGLICDSSVEHVPLLSMINYLCIRTFFQYGEGLIHFSA